MKPRDFGQYILLALLIAVFLTACSQEEEAVPPVMVNLGISVALSDMGAKTRAEEDAYREPTEGEKMHTLRIIIVRPDGRVEHNDFIDLASSPALQHGEVTYRVVGRETKKIYLVVNEGTLKDTRYNPANSKMVDYDFAAIAKGSTFPEEAINDLLISLNTKGEEVPAPLPMSECHEVAMPEVDHSVTLFVTRVATKFTYEITNNTAIDHTLTSVTITNTAQRAYFIPRATYDANQEIVAYEVPEDNGVANEYNRFVRSGFDALLLPGETVTLPAIYQLESKNMDVSGNQRYSTSITFYEAPDEANTLTFSEAFPNLPALPRNTHVVVRITINPHQVTWQVDVVPYGEVKLEPEFGLSPHTS